jgi:hypothetical protein
MNFKVNDIFENRSKSGHCRHATFIVKESNQKLYLVNTYWGAMKATPDFSAFMCNYTEVTPELNLDGFTHKGNLSEFTKSPSTSYLYANEDVIHLPVGGGSEETWIRTNAKPQQSEVVATHNYLVESLENQIKSIQSELAQLRAMNLECMEPKQIEELIYFTTRNNRRH